jgi:hypothetical protein
LEHLGMHRKQYVFGYDAEPTLERPTGFGQTGFGQTGFDAANALTVPAPWAASVHSTFDEPSHAFARVATIRRGALQTKLVVGTAIAATAALVVVALLVRA